MGSCCSILAACFAGTALADTEVSAAAVARSPSDAAAPFDARHAPSRLPIGFSGASILDLVTAIETADKASRGGVIASRFAGGRDGALQGATYRLVVPPELNPGLGADRLEAAGLSYDAERKLMRARLWSGQQMLRAPQASPPYGTILLARTWDESSYAAQNMLGTRTEVTAVRSDEYGLVLTNVTLAGPTALLSTTIPMRVDAAREAEHDLAFYVDVRLKAASGAEDGMLRDAVRQRATLSSPHDWLITQRFLLAELVEAGLFRRSTGEILTWKTFRPAHEGCAGAGCKAGGPRPAADRLID